MANLVIVCGKSGSGKSTASRNLDPKVSSLVEICNILKAIPEKAPHIKTVVIDTINRMMTDKVMGERHIKGFEKWTQLSGGIYDIFTIINKLI